MAVSAFGVFTTFTSPPSMHRGHLGIDRTDGICLPPNHWGIRGVSKKDASAGNARSRLVSYSRRCAELQGQLCAITQVLLAWYANAPWHPKPREFWEISNRQRNKRRRAGYSWGRHGFAGGTPVP